MEGDVVTNSFLGLLWIVDGQKSLSVIFDLLIGALKTWGLDMNKCIGFGSDGASTMVGKNTCVATLLKNVNHFLTSIYCVAHKTNLAALEASKTDGCKELSLDVDHVLNALAGHFNKSFKRKSILQTLQDELNDAQKTLKRHHKIRWFSRSQAVTTLCDSLESVLVYLRDSYSYPSVDRTHVLYDKLR